MGPQLPTPDSLPEMGNYHGPEAPQGPETGPRGTPEVQPRQESREQAPSGPAASAPPMPVLPTPIQAQPAAPVQQAQPTHAPSNQQNPIQAADDDLIEKEWVDRAKKIVTSTKNDPYLQEHEVSKLQADYINKRYGKTIKLTND